MKKLLPLILLLVFDSGYAQRTGQGLYFYAHKQNIDERTSLLLNNAEPYRLQNDLTLDFDVFLRNEAIKFGYIFRIISNSEQNFDFIIDNSLNAFFVIANQDNRMTNNLRVEQWNHITLTFRKKQNTISLRFNGEIIDCPYDLKDIRSLRICFGQCNYKNFQTNDVAPVILKDIKILVKDNELHHWELSKHGKNIVYDLLKNKPAIARHPYWTLDDHVYWKKIAEFQSVIFPQFTFDSISNNLYILNPNELIRYSIANGTEEHIESKPEVRGKFYNELLFDPIFSRLMFYRMETGSTYFFNPANHTWEGYEDSDKEPAHAHHNRYISVKDSSLYLFGGYGFYKYHSDFFKTNLVSRQNSIFDFSHTITPRYLSAMGGSAKENKLYILGGRGAEMGRQELSPKNFTNLFEVNLKTFKVKHLFDIETNETGENVYANSLVVDPDGKNLYALAYPYTELTSTITLKKINLETQQTEILANPLYFHFQDITSFCDLYYSPKLSKLIAVIAWSDNRQTSKIQIYTLDYLPLKENDVLQTVSHQSHLKFIFIAAFLLVAFLILDLFLYRKKRRVKSNAEEKKPKNEENTIVKAESAERKKDDRLFYNARKNSILFLGGFEVFDKNGDNITGEFTPTLKYMLVLIILYTLKNKKGISSGKLQELLWFDKNEQAARNNRNVNLRRLRVLLQNLGSIDISDNNAYWVIRLPDNVLSDYKEVLTLIAQMKNDDEVRREDLLRMLELLSYGEMLPNIQFEWVDDFKTHFSNTVIDTLTTILNNDKNTLCESPDIQLKIADALLKIDSINEEAIGIKCKLLVKMGKKGLAKITFDTFNKEYKILMGEPYSGSIKNFLD